METMNLTPAEANLIRQRREQEAYARIFNEGLEHAAQLAESQGAECAGGDGYAFIQEGPNKGQRYGEVWFNFGKRLRDEMKRG